MLKPVRRDRYYVALFVLTTTLAVGATTAVFTVANALWWRPQPVERPHELVTMVRRDQPRDPSRWSDAALADFREASVFAGVAGQVGAHDFSADLAPHIVLAPVGREVETLGVTEDYFSVLGVPVTGRSFSDSDDQISASPVAIISHRLWRQMFAGKQDVIGSTIPATPFPITIIGVAAAGFAGALHGERVDLWLPHRQLAAVAGFRALKSWELSFSMLSLGRMRTGATVHDVEAWMTNHKRPSFRTDYEVLPISRLFGAADLPVVRIAEGPTMTVIGASALAVTAGGAVTLMGMILMHYERRRQEFSVRLALGASRSRLCGQLATELAAVAAVGSAGALMFSWVLIALMPRLKFPSGVDLSRVPLGIDWRVMAVSIGVSVLAIAAAALLPVIRFSGVSLDRGASGHSATASRSSVRLRQTVLGAHVATSVTVLLLAALFSTSVSIGRTDGPGFDAGHTVFLSIQTWSINKMDLEEGGHQAAARTKVLVDRLRREPGINAVAFGISPLGNDASFRTGRAPRGLVTDTEQRSLVTAHVAVDSGYFDALGTAFTAGRAATRLSELVITGSLARELWPDESPLGKSLRFEQAAPKTIVGVVELGFGSLALGRPAVAFDGGLENLLDLYTQGMRLDLVVNASNLAGTRDRAARLAREVFPDAPSVKITTGLEEVDADLGRQHLAQWFFRGFAAIALTLSATGIFGLVAYLAHSRRREFGVMAALGATHAHIMRRAASVGLAPAIVGAAIGAAAAWMLRHALASFLLGVTDINAELWLVLGLVVLAGAAIGAISATLSLRRLSPLDALRD